MHPTDLIEHPEGGRFREVFRSPQCITTREGASRSAMTHIYFSLNPGEVSRFHKLTSDEIWHLYQGPGIDLFVWDELHNPPVRTTLSAECNCFCHVVPAGMWQAAAPVSETVLVGCSVAPGFEFDDFTLIDPRSAEAQQLLKVAPEMARFIVV